MRTGKLPGESRYHIRQRVANRLNAVCAAEQTAGARSFTLTSGPAAYGPNSEKVNLMLYTIAVVLVILWLLGLVTSYTLGGFIHILLVVALVMILINFISGRRGL